jgi:HEAT repeat protein
MNSKDSTARFRSAKAVQLATVLTSVGLLCAGWWVFDLTRPHYRGHTAAWWFGQLELGQAANQEVVTAFQAMGAQAVPFLISQLEARPSKAMAALDAVLIRWRPREPYDRRLLFRKERASRLLGDIGAPARPAIPGLETAASNSMWFVSTAAKAALIKIRGDPFDSYIQLLQDRSDCLTWYPNAMLLGELGTKASAAVPLLLDALQDTNSIIQAHALLALGMIRCEPERCVPAMTPFLTNVDVALRQKAFFAVRAFKRAAHSARQEIVLGLTDPDPWTRSQALLAVDEVLSSVEQRQALLKAEALLADPVPYVKEMAKQIVPRIRASASK